MNIHLVDGTYELFRAHFGAPPSRSPSGQEVGATRGLLRSMGAMLREPGVTHVGVAFDTVIESFRNELFEGYKTSEGVPEELLAQFPLAERAIEALGMTVWRMREFEADDAIATGAARYAKGKGVEKVFICTPDKDLAQSVRGTKVVALDRRKNLVIDEDGVRAKFGVSPGSIPDLLALVGDTADGIPGLERWGEKSAAAVLARYEKLEAIPDDCAAWDVKVRGAQALADSLKAGRKDALLYRTLATLREDVPLEETVADLEWRGARKDDLAKVCEELGERTLMERMTRFR